MSFSGRGRVRFENRSWMGMVVHAVPQPAAARVPDYTLAASPRRVRAGTSGTGCVRRRASPEVLSRSVIVVHEALDAPAVPHRPGPRVRYAERGRRRVRPEAARGDRLPHARLHRGRVARPRPRDVPVRCGRAPRGGHRADRTAGVVVRGVATDRWLSIDDIRSRFSRGPTFVYEAVSEMQ